MLQKGAGQKNTFNTVASAQQEQAQGEMAALIRYANYLGAEKPAKLKQARHIASVAFKRQSDPLNRMRLALALTTPPATTTQLRHAQSLLVEYISDSRPSDEDGRFIPMALFLLSRMRAQLKLTSQLQAAQAEQKKLKQKLHALTEVERKMNHTDQSGLGRSGG